jgi:hypothetical protein
MNTTTTTTARPHLRRQEGGRRTPDDVCAHLRRIAPGSAIRRVGLGVAQVIFRGGIEVFLRFEVIRGMPDLVTAFSDDARRKVWEDAYGQNVVRVVVSEHDGFVIASDGAPRDSTVTIVVTTAVDIISNAAGGARKVYEGRTFVSDADVTW